MKAVLVLDEIPNSCEECPLRYWGIAGWSCIHTRRLLEGPIAEREEWCPLRPLPEKKPVSYHDDLYGDVEKNYTNIGWNLCLEELEK